MNAPLNGVVPPVLTPLNHDGSVDKLSLRRLVDYLINAGVDGLFALGSSGEAVYLSDTQRREVMEIIVDATAGRVPILAGVIDMQTQRVIAQIKQLEDLDLAGIVATAPFYARTASAEVERHFQEIAQASQFPLWAYDIPVCVGWKLDVDMLMSLAQKGALAGVKDSSGDDVGFRRLVAANERVGHPLQVFTGHECMVDGMLLLGADGVVPGLGNVDPAGYVRLYQAAQMGDWVQAKLEQDRLAQIFEIVFQAKNLGAGAAGIGSFKTSLQLLGIFSDNRMSVPASLIEGEAVDRITAILYAGGLL